MRLFGNRLVAGIIPCARREASPWILAAAVATFAHPALAQTTTLMSNAFNGTPGNNDCETSAISANGRYIAFSSAASNLVPGDSNGRFDIFVRDRLTGLFTIASLTSGGAQSNGDSFRPSISADGHAIAFRSAAGNFDITDSNGADDIFVHDFQTGQTSRVSVDSDGVGGNAFSQDASISADGRYVAFQSGATNLVIGDTNDSTDIFVHDRQTGQTSRVSVSSAGDQADGICIELAMSGDGRFVAFTSSATNLVANDSNGQVDVFVRDLQAGQTTRVSVSSGGAESNHISSTPAISGDGRYVVFQSAASNLVPGDDNGVDDIFVHDRQTGQTSRVSTDSGGAQADDACYVPFISANGRFVTFGSASTNLVGGDTNSTDDVFLHDRLTGETTRVSVSSQGAQANSSSYWSPLSADGRFIAFASMASNLSPADPNSIPDVFLRDLLAPNNDECDSAAPILGLGSYDFSTIGFTDSDVGDSRTLRRDTWFHWTPDFPGDFTVSTCSTTTLDTRIAIYDAQQFCDGLVAMFVAFDDDSCGPQSSATFTAAPGHSYFIRIGESPTGLSPVGGGGTFSILPLGAIPFDECDTAQPINGFGPFPFDTTAFTDSIIPGDSLPIRRDSWYAWTAPFSGRFLISTCGLSTVSSTLAVYGPTGCEAVPMNLVSLTDGRIICDPQTMNAFDAVADQTYLIRIGENPFEPDTGGGESAFRITAASAVGPIHVARTGTLGDGSAWDAVLRTFGNALRVANLLGPDADVEVKAAHGTYRPLEPLVVFSHHTLAIRGGYAGPGAPDPDDRLAGSTIISGDTNADDGPGFTNRADNLPFLVLLTLNDDHAVTLDGIRFNDAGRPGSFGRAVNVNVSDTVTTASLSVTECQFNTNLADGGTGGSSGAAIEIIDLEGTHPVMASIANCLFADNRTDGSGGALAVFGPHDVRLTQCTFASNSTVAEGDPSPAFGGAIAISDASLTLDNCGFFNNTATGRTGGVSGGGAIAHFGSGRFDCKNSHFNANTATDGDGGAVYLGPESGPAGFGALANAKFFENTAAGRGGAILNSGRQFLNLANIYARDNDATDGAAVYINEVTSSFLGIDSSTFLHNSSSLDTGSAIKHSGDGPIDVNNSIFWKNSAAGERSGHAQLAIDADTKRGGGTITARYCIIQNHADAFPGIAITDADPRIIEGVYDAGPDHLWGTKDDVGYYYDRYRLLPGSPAVDAGERFLLPLDELDLDGDATTLEALPLDLLGAERLLEDPFTSDTGPGGPPHLDLGCIERDSNLDGVKLRTIGGAFHEPSVWQPFGPPGSNDTVVMSPSDFSLITMGLGATIGQLVIQGDSATILVPPFPLTILHPRPDALAVGPWAGESPALTLNTSVLVQNGGVCVGAPDGSSTALLAIAGTLESNDAINVYNSSLILADGDIVAPPIDGLRIDSRSELTVDRSGVIQAGVLNRGRISLTAATGRQGPIGESPAQLIVNGEYTQIGSGADGLPASGSLAIRIGGDQDDTYDRLVVNGGHLHLAGTLDLSLINGYLPDLGAAPVSVVTATGVSDSNDPGRFDVINAPGLSDGRFLRVSYDRFAFERGSGFAVNVVVDQLARIIGLQPPAGFDTPGAPRNAALGDLNGDGFLDLAVLVPGPTTDDFGDLIILINAGTNPDGSWAEFDSASTVQIAVGRNPIALTISDFNDDGLNDVAVLNNTDENFVVYVNTTLVRGTVTPQFAPTPPRAAGRQPLAIASADFSGDARPDIAIAARDDLDTGAIFVSVNSGGSSGDWAGMEPVGAAAPVPGTPTSINPVDIDDDKDLDLVGVMPESNPGVYMILNPGSAGERAWPGFIFPSIPIDGGQNPTSINPVDIDDDKDLDLAATNGTSGRVSIVLQTVAGTFAPPAATDVGAAPASIVSVDLDQDGDRDLALIAGDVGSRELVILRNDLLGGQVTLTQVPAPDVGADPIQVLVGNMDNDTDEDLVTINEHSGIERAANAPPAALPLGRAPGNAGRGTTKDRPHDVSVILSAPSCVGDTNADGTVGQPDIDLIIKHWGQKVLPGTFGDANHDGVVTLHDIALVIETWGESC